MAEVIGLISAIGSIAAAGLKVAKAIYSLADELGTAGARVRVLATDTKTITWVLRELKRRLERAKSIPAEGVEAAHETAMSIKDEINEIDGILKPLTIKEGKQMSKRQKAKWIFTKSQLTTHQVALDSLKGSLNLVLNTLSFIEGEEDRDVLEVEVEHVQSESKNTKTLFLNAERQDRAMEKAFIAYQSQCEGTVSDEGKTKEHMRLSYHQREVDDDETHGDMTLTRLPAALSQADLNIDSENMDIAHTISDEQFMTIARHMRIQRRALSFANSVIHRQQDERQSGAPSRESGTPPEEESGSEDTDVYGQFKTSTTAVHEGLSSYETESAQRYARPDQRYPLPEIQRSYEPEDVCNTSIYGMDPSHFPQRVNVFRRADGPLTATPPVHVRIERRNLRPQSPTVATSENPRGFGNPDLRRRSSTDAVYEESQSHGVSNRAPQSSRVARDENPQGFSISIRTNAERPTPLTSSNLAWLSDTFSRYETNPADDIDQEREYRSDGEDPKRGSSRHCPASLASSSEGEEAFDSDEEQDRGYGSGRPGQKSRAEIDTASRYMERSPRAGSPSSRPREFPETPESDRLLRYRLELARSRLQELQERRARDGTYAWRDGETIREELALKERLAYEERGLRYRQGLGSSRRIP